MFNIHILIAVEEWRLKYRNLIPKWFAVLAEFDALSGLAAFSFNNPEFVYPELNSGEYMLMAEKIGHPLILCDTCVTNDFEIRGWKQFYIITGAEETHPS
jgi:DNA mismatch repair ATPase MutS